MVTAAPLDRAFFDRPVLEVAPALIGCVLTRNGVGGPIVEVEAYDQTDEASHSFRGPTPGNAAMFGPAGHVYVYRSYGVHWCMNLVCDGEGHGAGVLLRAIEPVLGADRMRLRRAGRPDRELTSGPGRLTAALGVTGEHDGVALGGEIVVSRASGAHEVLAGPRIGITKATDRPWRYASAESRYLSHPCRPKAR